jgi:protein O-mannosyl-transferase
VLALAALAAYANHFDNGFHFDDFHTVSDNIFIRDLRNVPRFFADAEYTSTLPDHRTYRPVVSTSLAFDYWLGRGLKPFWFQLSTFVWYVVQLILMFFLFRRIMDCSEPHSFNVWTAFFAALCYGLHPVNAETVNYVIQRADL